jgi:zinc/manganese transport system permease protein
VLVTWVGVALAYFYDYPVGFYITTVAFAVYVGVRIVHALAGRSTPARIPTRTAAGEA